MIWKSGRVVEQIDQHFPTFTKHYFGSNLTEIPLMKQLDFIQNRALRLAFGAYCSSSTDSLSVEANTAPLDIRRLQPSLQYAAKVKHVPPTLPILIPYPVAYN